jgi:RNA polymerase sigma factor (sigma-70 family)
MERMELEDVALLRDYVASKSEPAFRTLVERHVNMVYATALRQVQDAHLAEEATQAVFIALARKARSLSPKTILAGWLFRAAQFAGAKARRSEARRKHWEYEAAQMEPIEGLESDGESAWDQIAPFLNDALNQLKEADRAAVILRFFESKSIAQIGSALGTSESATKMRIARALEQLRGIFHSRGIALPIALLSAALGTQATNAAPAGLAASIATSALLKQTAIPLLTKGTLLLMTWNNRKTAVAAAIALLLCGGTTALILHRFAFAHPDRADVKVAGESEDNPTPTIEFTMQDERRDPLNRAEGAVERLTLRLAPPADGDAVEADGTRAFVVVNGSGTNGPAGTGERRGRRVTSYKVRTAVSGGGDGAEIGASSRSTAPTPAPQPRTPQ